MKCRAEGSKGHTVNEVEVSGGEKHTCIGKSGEGRGEK